MRQDRLILNNLIVCQSLCVCSCMSMHINFTTHKQQQASKVHKWNKSQQHCGNSIFPYHCFYVINVYHKSSILDTEHFYIGGCYSYKDGQFSHDFTKYSIILTENGFKTSKTSTSSLVQGHSAFILVPKQYVSYTVDL